MNVLILLEMFRKLLDEAQAGDNIGALLRGIQRTEIERGQVLAKPGTVTCHKKFTAQVYVLTKDAGGESGDVFVLFQDVLMVLSITPDSFIS